MSRPWVVHIIARAERTRKHKECRHAPLRDFIWGSLLEHMGYHLEKHRLPGLDDEAAYLEGFGCFILLALRGYGWVGVGVAAGCSTKGPVQ